MDMHCFQLGRHDQDFLHAQWVSLASRYASDPSAIESLFNSIVEHYSAKNRAYHNLSHIQSLLSLSESLPDKIQNRDALYFAVWFHDVIYDTKRSDNEEKSAEFAEEALASLGVPERTIAVTREMILATKHHRADDLSWDVKAFLDLDTSILGAPEEIYKDYSWAIRKEYSWVPGFLYLIGTCENDINDWADGEHQRNADVLRGSRSGRAAGVAARLHRLRRRLGAVRQWLGRRASTHHPGPARPRRINQSVEGVYISAIRARRLCTARQIEYREVRGDRRQRRRKDFASHGHAKA